MSIGPLCPVEPCNSTLNPYVDLEVVLATPGGNEVIRVPLGGSGTFQVVAPVGVYIIDIEPCEFLGCSQSVPVEVEINSTAPTVVELDIDTGIR